MGEITDTLRAAGGGDRDAQSAAFRLLEELIRERVNRWICKLYFGPRAVADAPSVTKLSSDAYLKTLEAINKATGKPHDWEDRQHFLNFVNQRVEWILRDELRRFRRRNRQRIKATSSLFEQVPDPGTSVESAVQKKEAAAQKEEILQKVIELASKLLNEEQKACFYLYYFEDNPQSMDDVSKNTGIPNSMDDVSKILGIPKTNVSRRLGEALKILRPLLNPQQNRVKREL
jgi:RNA polymerase sigma factor (sigma-70 family)